MNLGLSTRRQNPAIGKPLTAVPQLLSVRTFLVLALCLGAVGFAVYSPSLNFQFVLDDHRFTGDPRIQFPDHVWDYFANYVWAQFTGGPPSFYRPLFLVWLRINFILSAMSPWGWHLLSVVKHLAVAVLLGLLVLRLLRDRTERIGGVGHRARSVDVRGNLGCVASILQVASGRSSKPKSRKKVAQDGPDEEVRSASGVLADCLRRCLLCGTLGEGNSIILPVLIFASALIVPRGENGGADFRVRLRRALRQTVPFLCVTGLYLLMRFHALGGKLASRTQSLPWSTVLLSWPATLWFYVKVLLWPDHSRAFADPTLAQRFSFRGVIMPGLGVACAVAILALALIWAWKKARRDLPPQDTANLEYALVIGTLLLVLPILLTLDLNALNPGDSLHGRYTYLPSAGLMLVLATVWHLSGKLRVPLLCACGLLAVVFTVLVVSQEKQWKDDLTVFTVAHELAPHNAPVAKNLADAHVQVALQLADDGRCSEAMPVFQQVSQEYPQDWYAWAGLGDCFVQLNNLPKAEESLRRAAELSHDSRVMQQWQELRAHMGLPNSAPHD